jgi:hypothetical protein
MQVVDNDLFSVCLMELCCCRCRCLRVCDVISQVLMLALPGKIVFGETTPNGTRWRYKINSLLAFFVSGAMYLVASFYLGWFSPAVFNGAWCA